jgi:hypothetical protein
MELEQEVALLGQTGAYDYHQFEHFKIEIDRDGFADETVDRNGDGEIDYLDVAGKVRVDDGGTYAVNALLVAGDGTEVAESQGQVVLATGLNDFTLNFPWQSIQAAGLSGTFSVEDLSIYPVAASDTLGYLLRAWVTQPYQLSGSPIEKSCRGSAYQLEPAPPGAAGDIVAEPLAANPGYDPCTDDLNGAANTKEEATLSGPALPVPVVTSVSVDEVGATTAASAGRADAGASLTENLTIAVTSPAELEMTVTAASSDAVARCSAGAPSLAGSSTVKDVTLAGVRYEPLGPGPAQFDVPGIGSLHLHYQQTADTDSAPGPDRIIQRAVFLDSVVSSVPDVIVGESIAGIRGC